MLKGLTRWVISPSHHLITQIGIDLWVLPHPMKYHKPIIWTSTNILQLIMILDKIDNNFMLDVHYLSESPKVALNSSINISKSLNKGDWCSNKSANQTIVMPNNNVLMSPTWTRPVGYWRGWNQMTKHIRLTIYLKTLNMCYQTCQVGWSVAPLVGVGLLKCIPKRSKLH
jgi:hypothetical protein